MAGKTLVAVGLIGTILTSYDDGVTWYQWPRYFNNNETNFYGPTLLGAAANSSVVLAGGYAGLTTAGTLIVSSNGYHWTDADLSSIVSGFRVTSIGCNDSLCVAAGYIFGAQTLVIITSADNGATWTQQTAPSISVYLSYIDNPVVYVGSSLAIVAGEKAGGSLDSYLYTSSDGGVTWNDHTPTSPKAGCLIGGVGGNSTTYFAVGADSFGNALIFTSPDAVTWTQRTADGGTGQRFRGVYATDSLVVAVGHNLTKTAGFINTSSDGGVTWISRSVDASVETLLGVTYNGSVWCAVGVVSSGANAILTSTDGITWTLQTFAGLVQLNSVTSFTSAFPTPGAYTVYVYDDSCHLYTSTDVGATWAESHQNLETIGDDWMDLQLPVNDGDYRTMLSTDDDYQGGWNGAIAISVNYGLSGTWVISNPDPVHNLNDPNDYIAWLSGGISTASNIVLLLPTYSTQGGVSTDWSMFISRDGGSTWGSTGPARKWYSCCFNIGATIMYAISYNNYVSKSIDSGVSWSDLTSSPINTSPTGVSKGNAERIRCTPNGSTIIYASSHASKLYISKDSGATWVTALSFGWGGQFSMDCGLSADGLVMLTFDNIADLIYLSTDGGASWSTRAGSSGIYYIESCNVSPDGQGLVVVYANYTCDISTDKGVTWNTVFIPDITFDAIVASYILPNVAPPPPTPATVTRHRQIRDPWDCDEWGRFQPGVCIRKIY